MGVPPPPYVPYVNGGGDSPWPVVKWPAGQSEHAVAAVLTWNMPSQNFSPKSPKQTLSPYDESSPTNARQTIQVQANMKVYNRIKNNSTMYDISQKDSSQADKYIQGSEMSGRLRIDKLNVGSQETIQRHKSRADEIKLSNRRIKTNLHVNGDQDIISSQQAPSQLVKVTSPKMFDISFKHTPTISKKDETTFSNKLIKELEEMQGTWNSPKKP